MSGRVVVREGAGGVEMRLTAAEIAGATDGELNGSAGALVTSYTGDPGRVEAGACFVAVEGERDERDAIGDAFRRGAAVVVSRWSPMVPKGSAVVCVPEPLPALAALGRLARRRLASAKVVGITGSSGKTATKDLLSAAVAASRRVHASPASYNNMVGLPLTLLTAGESAEVVVAEMGARFAANIADLCAIAAPDVGVITNIGMAHAGSLGGRPGIARVKGELLEAPRPNGLAVLDAADEFTPALARRTSARVLTVGVGSDVVVDIRARDVVLDDVLRPSFRLQTPWGDVPVTLELRGSHQVANAAMGAGVALWLGVPVAEVALGLGRATPAPWRMEVTRTVTGIMVLNDAYNASPTSMEAALRSLARLRVAERRLAVLGEMGELGEHALREHERIGRLTAECGVEVLIVVGDAASAIVLDARAGARGPAPWPTVLEVADPDAALTALTEQARPDDAVLIKGSRTVGLERVADGLIASSGSPQPRRSPSGGRAQARRPLRILLTNFRVAWRLGGECHLRDLALELVLQGHEPVVYTPQPGMAADELRKNGVPVIDDFDRLSVVPDVIHGHDSYTTLVALESIPRVPAVTTTHSWGSPLDVPLHHPRLLAWIAVGTLTRRRLVARFGVDGSRVTLIPNAVDLERFITRSPLPARPVRALVFNNYAMPDAGYVLPVREACLVLGMELDVVGEASQRSVDAPEQLLRDYDLVFATGRCAREAAAVGCAVVLCGPEGLGPMVTTGWLDSHDRIEFGRRELRLPITAERVAVELGRYDADDAATVSARTREASDLHVAVDTHLAVYERVVKEGVDLIDDPRHEQRAVARWLAKTAAPVEQIDRMAWERLRTNARLETIGGDCERLRSARDAAVASLTALEGTRTFRARRRILRLPGVGAVARRLRRNRSEDSAGYAEYRGIRGGRLDERLSAVAGIAALKASPSRVLHLGCSGGELIAHSARRGATVTVVDDSPEAIDWARVGLDSQPAMKERVELLCDDVVAVRLHDLYDVAVAVDRMEHLAPSELDQLYDKVAGHLDPTGWFVIHTSDEQPMPGLTAQLGKHFPHVVAWAANFGDLRGTLDMAATASKLEARTEVFAVASHSPVDPSELRRGISMEPLTPSDAAALQLEIVSPPRLTDPRGRFSATVALTNGGTTMLNSNLPNPFHLSYHWLDDNGRVVLFDGARTRLLPWLPPGASEHYTLVGTAPPRAGARVVRLTAVQENVKWFDDATGFLAVDWKV